jgi:hypothetical protein
MKGKTMALHASRFGRLAAAALVAFPAVAALADDMGLPALPGALPQAVAPAQAAPLDDKAEIAKLQAQIKDLLDQEAGIKQSESALDSAIDRVMNATGLHLGGTAVVQSENMLAINNMALQTTTQVPGTVNQYNMNEGLQRIWPTIGYFDFDITARPTPDLSAEVVYRLEKIFGGFWGQEDVTGIRWFNIHGDTPINFDFGTFHYQNTPLTFWVPQDEYAFEPAVLAMKRTEGRQDALIKDQSFPLEGGRLGTTLLLFNTLDLDLETVGLRTAVAGNSNTSLPFAVIFPYDQYLVGGTAKLSGDRGKLLTLGFSYFNLQESPDTAISPSDIPAQYSSVEGADFKLNFGKVVLHGEGAYSQYNPAIGTSEVVSWTTGGAGNVILDVKTDTQKLSVHALYVDPAFINYAAQTRDESPLQNFAGFMPTGNNLYNPYTGSYFLAEQSNIFFSSYNSVIFATNQGPKGGLVLNANGVQPGGIFISPSQLNLSTPEGFATPNRAGAGGDYQGKFFDGFLQPRVFGSFYSEPEVDYWVPGSTGRDTFTKGGGGALIDLSAVSSIPLKISAGIVIEDTQANSFVAFTSTRLGYDMDYEMYKNFHVLAGFEHVDLNGGEFWDYGIGYGPAYVWEDYAWDNYVAGVDYKLSKSTDVFLTYSFDQFTNKYFNNAAINAAEPFVDTTSADTQTQEWEFKLRMEF